MQLNQIDGFQNSTVIDTMNTDDCSNSNKRQLEQVNESIIKKNKQS